MAHSLRVSAVLLVGLGEVASRRAYLQPHLSLHRCELRRGTLHASPSVCQAGTLEEGGQGRLELGESEAPGRGGRHA